MSSEEVRTIPHAGLQAIRDNERPGFSEPTTDLQHPLAAPHCIVDKSFEIGRFDHEGWHVRILVRWDQLERRFAGRAELFLDGAFRCRIALAKGIDSEAEAAESLQRRAREFIADWGRRDHEADSEFSEL